MRGPFVNYKKHWQWKGKWFVEIPLGAFLDIVRPLSLKWATVIPVTNSVQLLATHLVVDWEGYLVGNVGSETSLWPLFLPIGWSRSLKG